MKELNPEYFFFKLPIYKPILINEDNREAFDSFMDIGVLPDSFTGNEGGKEEYYFEGYNPYRKVDSTFKVLSTRYRNLFHDIMAHGGVEEIKLVCRRYEETLHFFINYDVDKKTLMKIGQYPSVADFHTYQIKRFNKLLSKEKLREFSKAIGLAANGVGIGSFVYLRRIFEHLILDAFVKNEVEIEIDKPEFLYLKMDEKIQLLKKYLPEFLIKNKTLYSILSLGIHELKEEDCLAYFDTVKIGIEVILEEQLEVIKKQQRIKEAERNISNLHNRLKSKDG